MGWPRRATAGVLIYFAVAFAATTSADGAFVGVVYGTNGGDGAPTPEATALLLRANGVNHVRIYDTNPTVLRAFSNTTLQLVVGVTNEELGDIGQSNVTAANWVKSNVLPFTPWLNITTITVGSEILSHGSNLSSILVPTMRYIHAALVDAGLDAQIKVTTPHSITVLESSFPPSQGAFNRTLFPVILPLLNFLQSTGSFLMLNLYPYYSYQANSQAIGLPYAVFGPNLGVSDAYTQLRYTSLYDALLDAGYAAMKALNFSQLGIVVSETGWPSAGDPSEVGASQLNAAAYNGNLAKRIFNGTGTPARPLFVPSAYIYELFNEETRTGPTSERSWGLFFANQTPAYSIDLTGTGRAFVGNSTNETWCVAKQGVTESSLQQAMDYACGQGGANCTAIQTGGACWNPNNVQSHASYAMNAYYQKEGDEASTCEFKGAGMITTIDPSFGSCIFFTNDTVTGFRQTGANTGVLTAPVNPMIYFLPIAVVLAIHRATA